MARRQERLTFVDDSTILIVSSLGLLCVGAAVLWVIRQSPDWAAIEDEEGPPLPLWRRLLRLGVRGAVRQNHHHEEVEGEGELRGGTRVVRGGRQAAKAARKEAKKRAKEDFRRSQEAVAAHKTRQRLKNERRRAQDKDHAEESAARSIAESAAKEASERAVQAERKLESYILSHKVSSLVALENELGIPLAEVTALLKQLETNGRIMGIFFDSRSDGVPSSYIRVSLDELRTLATFVNERGRLNVAEFVHEANEVLQLSPPSEEQETSGVIGVEDLGKMADGSQQPVLRRRLLSTRDVAEKTKEL